MKDIIEKIIADPRYQKNIEYGEPRSGHPEGKVKYHIANLEANLEKLAAHGIPDSPIISLNSHASLAKKFASEFIDDEDLLNMIQFHDVNFALWKQFAATGTYDTQRFESLLETIQDWDLFLMFIIIDGSTEGKDLDKLRWFIREVRKYKNTRVDESWMV